jgi:hypothetical protein
MIEESNASFLTYIEIKRLMLGTLEKKASSIASPCLARLIISSSSWIWGLGGKGAG